MGRASLACLLCLVLAWSACTRGEQTQIPDASAVQPAPLKHLVRLTGGATAAERLPMIVAIHGLGDSPEGFWGVLSELETPARVILPAGPHPASTDGRSWFQVGTRAGQGLWLSEMELVASTDQVAALVRGLLKRYPTRAKPIVTGFSQGGILAYSLVVRHPDLFRLAVPVGGFLPEGLLPRTPLSGLAHPRIRALHGAADSLVPVSAARASITQQKRLGLDASLTEFADVGHGIPGPVQAALVRLLVEGCEQVPGARP